MTYDINQILKFAISSNLFINPNISFLAEGYGNYNFLIEDLDKKSVLRIKKISNDDFIDSLQKEYVFLKYFEFCGIDFLPKALYFDANENFLIESFLEGDLISQKKFTNQQIDLFAKQLCDLYHLDVDYFEIFCKENDLKFYGYESPIKSLKTFGFNRFKIFEDSNLDPELNMWIEENLNYNLEYLTSCDVSHIGFNWGDIQAKVIINSTGMFFYDFEFVSISHGKGLSYIKVHGRFDDNQFNYLLERYSFYSKISIEELEKEIIMEQKIIRVNDVVWAAMMWAQSESEVDINKFKDLTFQRKKKFEDLFLTNISRNG